MTIDERTRHQLYLRLEEVLGTEEATTLMEHLPPVGWADVATKADLGVLRSDLVVLRSDLVALEQRLELRFESLEHRLRADFQRDLRTTMIAVVAANAAVVAAVVSIVAVLTNAF